LAEAPQLVSPTIGAETDRDWPIFPIFAKSMARFNGADYIPAPMKNKNTPLYKALFNLLRPVARLCLHFGIGYREYCELSKAAFVSVAADDYGVHGRPTNASRIAAMTGLTRKEISRLRKRADSDDAPQTTRGTPLREILAAWQTENEFIDRRGRPCVLPLEGERGSFHSLVKQFAGDIPDGALRKELERIGAVERKGNMLRLIPKDQAELDAAMDRARVVLRQAAAQLDTLARRAIS
jgi:hypothetical protein